MCKNWSLFQRPKVEPEHIKKIKKDTAKISPIKRREPKRTIKAEVEENVSPVKKMKLEPVMEESMEIPLMDESIETSKSPSSHPLMEESIMNETSKGPSQEFLSSTAISVVPQKPSKKYKVSEMLGTKVE